MRSVAVVVALGVAGMTVGQIATMSIVPPVSPAGLASTVNGGMRAVAQAKTIKRKTDKQARENEALLDSMGPQAPAAKRDSPFQPSPLPPAVPGAATPAPMPPPTEEKRVPAWKLKAVMTGGAEPLAVIDLGDGNDRLYHVGDDVVTGVRLHKISRGSVTFAEGKKTFVVAPW